MYNKVPPTLAAFILILNFDPIKSLNKKALEKYKKRKELFVIAR